METPMYCGTAWYPEHWPEERWARDIELMCQAGMNVVRVGEFAWSRMEPADSDIQLDWLVRAVDQAVAAGLAVVMCTPTPTPPAWLTSAYPDILAVRNRCTGELHLHGERGHVDPSNKDYQRACVRICEALARHFGKHPGVIGWQTDNEFWSIAANDSAMVAFRNWLRQEYGTLDRLNEVWSTSFWSQEYFSWDDIQPPMDYPNPALYHAWYRFHSHLTRDFQRLQIDAIRSHADDRQWITHNFHPYDEFDRTVISEDLDLVSWDAYITGESLRLDPAANGHDCDRLRGIKRKNIWIMETLPGFVNWREVNRHCEPGETRAMAWHMIGHGADAILYWQWRSAPTNQEQYHGCLLQQDGEPRPIYHEIARFGQELQRLAPLLAGSRPANTIALIDRWGDRQAIKNQPHHQDYIPRERVIDWYRAWQSKGHCLDVLPRLELLDDYTILLAPHLHLLSQDEADRLRRWILNGGHLVLGPRSGMKDEHNRLWPKRQPGPLGDLLGASVAEFFALPESIPLSGGLAGEARIFAELLEPNASDVDVLASYGAGNGWLVGTPAAVTRQADQGRITYLACAGDDALHGAIHSWLVDQHDLTPLLRVPDGVEATRRVTADGQNILILINHGLQSASIDLGRPMIDHLSGTVSDRVVMAASDCLVLTAP